MASPRDLAALLKPGMPTNPALAWHPALTGAEQYGGAMEPAQKPDVAGLVQALGSARDAMGGSIADRMAHHGAQQQARMASGNFSPTPVTADSMDLADSVAGGLVGNIGLAAAIKAYHGSPHRFDRFDMSKIGTGEGAQAYGHGLYMAESPDVARQYKQKLEVVSEEPFRALGIPDKDIPQAVSLARSTHPAAMDIAARDFADWTGFKRDDALVDAFKKSKQPGALYTTRIDVEPEDLLDWDAPLSQQSEKVRAALEKSGKAQWFSGQQPVGATLRRAAQNELYAGDIAGKDRATIADVSAALREAGIPGIRYLDQGSRASGEGTRNFVIFDDKLIDIEGVE